MAAQNVIETFLRDGKSICPWSRTCALLHVEVSSVPKNDRTTLVKAVRQFIPTLEAPTPTAFVVEGPMSLNFEETKEWAIQVFLELQTVLWLSIGLTLTSLEDYIKNEVEPTLRDDYSEKRLFLSYRSQPLFSICMAPCYSDKHPRYAPSPIVVVTWAYDVGQAHKNNQLVQKVHDAMAKGYGQLYAADELMLPLTP